MLGKILRSRPCPHLKQQQVTARAHLQRELAKKKGALVEIPVRAAVVKTHPA